MIMARVLVPKSQDMCDEILLLGQINPPSIKSVEHSKVILNFLNRRLSSEHLVIYVGFRYEAAVDSGTKRLQRDLRPGDVISPSHFVSRYTSPIQLDMSAYNRHVFTAPATTFRNPKSKNHLVSTIPHPNTHLPKKEDQGHREFQISSRGTRPQTLEEPPLTSPPHRPTYSPTPNPPTFIHVAHHLRCHTPPRLPSPQPQQKKRLA
ncbi:hypothetical protein BS50DRAFT_121217 [Corynespora cassiicola Philippines]|uniref:Uncharacterized protein n=1 Tax=Corynespora cassiicola Philippines TaxID=1448308 RepID=A0A2T2NAR6_CORCC|nr:hypothetical protein BS50DRAFT_121217 [Corynespora cassiicola Philippines]